MLFLLILILCFFFQFLFPWWCIAFVSGIASFFLGKSWCHSLLSAFIAVFFLWIGMSLWKSVPNEHVLLGRVAGLFGLPQGGAGRAILLIITGLTGGIAAGVAALTGYYWRKAFFPGKS
jgi:hypothetical protein